MTHRMRVAAAAFGDDSAVTRPVGAPVWGDLLALMLAGAIICRYEGARRWWWVRRR